MPLSILNFQTAFFRISLIFINMLRLLIPFFFIKLSQTSLPVVLWHGMGDSCCEYGSLGKIITILKAKMPDTEILSLKFGEHVWEDIENSYFMNVNEQVELACEKIKSKNFANGYNAIGFSQGGQFLRAVAQRCPDPPMRKLISLGGQHQGVYGLPNCGQPSPPWCDYIRKLLNNGAYIGWIQKGLVQAEYWHDPLDEASYRKYSIFLADINNEKDVKNATYNENLQKLQALVLVMFERDTMVIPKESSWFGFYAPGQSDIVFPYNQTRLYKKDLIGLRKLVNGGKVDFLSVDGNHLHFTEEWFIQNIVQRYLM